MYRSPIEMIQTEMQMQMEDDIVKAVQKVDINIDKERLLKALEFDRGQYVKGYQDGQDDVCERIIEKLQEFATYYEKSVEELIGRPMTMHNIQEREKCVERMSAFRDAIQIVEEEMG